MDCINQRSPMQFPDYTWLISCCRQTKNMTKNEIHSSAYVLSDSNIKCTYKKIKMQLLKGIEHTVLYWKMTYPFVNSIVSMKSTICTSKKIKK